MTAPRGDQAALPPVDHPVEQLGIELERRVVKRRSPPPWSALALISGAMGLFLVRVGGSEALPLALPLVLLMMWGGWVIQP